MTLELGLGFAFFVAGMVILLVYEMAMNRKFRQLAKEANQSLQPLAERANKCHRQKFGRASTELEKAFPPLKHAK